MALDQEEVVTFKQFSDFKQLDLIIKLTCFRMEESGDYMPILPQKRNAATGNKKSGDELQLELVEYMRDLLRIGKLQRMFYLRLFLSTNHYHSISEDIFNEIPEEEPMLAQNTFSQSRRVDDNSLLRESQDISHLVAS